MPLQRRFRIAVGILVCILLPSQGADKYTDENRPYEFGFNVEIEGSKQQHRHEKKDKDGIIMGEFGFVTADDVYHVTVYATDKEGRFKILSMKNIHLKKSAPAPAAPARQGHSLALPALPAAPAPATFVATTRAPFKQISLEPPIRSCSSCSIPTTTKVPPPASVNFDPQNQQSFPAAAPAFSSNVQPGGFGNQPFTPQAGPPSYSQPGPVALPGGQAYPQQPGPPQPNYPVSSPNVPSNYVPQQNLEPPQQGGQPALVPSSGGRAPKQYTGVGQPFGGPTGQQEPGPVQGGQPGYSPVQGGQPGYSPVQGGQPGYSPVQGGQPGNSPVQGGQPGYSPVQGGQPGYNPIQGGQQGFSPAQNQPGPVKPTLVSAQMQIVDKNTDINALRPGEQPGLPAGLNKDDMTQLLYTFNYTVGFHGHFEEGYASGAKKGYYFVTGRNGVRTRIDYTADDTGFHPKISQEVLDLLSDDVPKPETEKDEKYGLKGYEFKWLYYPV